MALITVAELGQYTGQTLTSDTRASQIVNAVNEQVPNYIGRLFGVPEGGQEVTEVFDYKPLLFLNNLDIQSVTELKVFGEVRAEGKYTLNKTTGRLVLSRSWSDTPSLVQNSIDLLDAVEITYKAGKTTVPADLKLACLQLASDNYFKGDSADDAGGLSSASVGGLSLSFGGNAQASTKNADGSSNASDYMSVLNYYKRHRLG